VSRFSLIGLVLSATFLSFGPAPGQEPDQEPPPSQEPIPPPKAPTLLELEIRGLPPAVTPLRGLLRSTSGQHGARQAVARGFMVRGDGTHRVGPLPAGGSYVLQLVQPVPGRGFSATLLAQRFEVEPGKTNRVRIDLNEGVEVSGTIEGPDGEPLAEVAVTAASPTDREVQRGALTGRDGRFRLNVPKEGAYLLTAQRWLPRTGPG